MTDPQQESARFENSSVSSLETSPSPVSYPLLVKIKQLSKLANAVV